MHARHGSGALWQAVVAPAERLARLGVPVSRALSRDLQAGAVALGADSEARRIFGRGSGTAVTEGDNFVADRSRRAPWASIRQRGGGDFFDGQPGARCCPTRSRRSAAACRSKRCATPCRRPAPPAGESYGGFRVYVAPAPMAGANALAGWNGQPAPAAGVPTDSGGISGLAAIDAKGGAAACSLSMGQLFGARVIVPGTGILLGTPTADSTSVSPLVIGNPGNGEVLFAGAGGGSPSAAYATGAHRARHGRATSSTSRRRSRRMPGRAATSTPSPVPTASAAAARPATAAPIRPAPGWRCSPSRR